MFEPAPGTDRTTNGAYKARHSLLGLLRLLEIECDTRDGVSLAIKVRTGHLSSTRQPSSPFPWSCCHLETLQTYENSRLKVEQLLARSPYIRVKYVYVVS